LIGKPVSMVIEKPLHDSYLVLSALILKTKQNNSSMRLPITIHLFAKILVVRDKDSILCEGPANDLIIVHPASLLKDGKDVVMNFPKPLGHGWAGTLVNEEPHSGSLRD
jgi:hypothetical protein